MAIQDSINYEAPAAGGIASLNGALGTATTFDIAGYTFENCAGSLITVNSALAITPPNTGSWNFYEYDATGALTVTATPSNATDVLTLVAVEVDAGGAITAIIELPEGEGVTCSAAAAPVSDDFMANPGYSNGCINVNPTLSGTYPDFNQFIFPSGPEDYEITAQGIGGFNADTQLGESYYGQDFLFHAEKSICKDSIIDQNFSSSSITDYMYSMYINPDYIVDASLNEWSYSVLSRDAIEAGTALSGSLRLEGSLRQVRTGNPGTPVNYYLEVGLFDEVSGLITPYMPKTLVLSAAPLQSESAYYRFINNSIAPTTVGVKSKLVIKHYLEADFGALANAHLFKMYNYSYPIQIS